MPPTQPPGPLSRGSVRVLITAVATSAIVIFALLGGDALREGLLPPSASRILLCVCVISWIGYIAINCRDYLTAHVDRRLAELQHTLDDAITRYGDYRATDALTLDAGRTPTPRPPGVNGRISLVD